MHDKKSTPKEQPEETESNEQETVEQISNPEVDALKSQLSDAQAKVQEYLDALQRERADFVNYRRRTELENALVGRVASGSTIKKFLSGIDDLERALAHRTAGDVWADGIELVYRKFLSILDAEGVTRMQAEGQPFNPVLHEAIMQEPSDKHESGMVIAILQQGYMHGDRVLRPALVKVAQ
ncbi:MAG: nucleotide exchange factor GrpE [Chloroflexi bacterium]|nr:nucleotide exchange factor GrpE [Chloroflexota bacterium]